MTYQSVLMEEDRHHLLPSLNASHAHSCTCFSINFFLLQQDKLDIRQAVDGGHVVSGLTEVVVKDKEQVSLLRVE